MNIHFKINMIAGGLLIASFAVLFFAHFSSAQTASSSPTSTPSSGVATTTFSDQSSTPSASSSIPVVTTPSSTVTSTSESSSMTPSSSSTTPTSTPTEPASSTTPFSTSTLTVASTSPTSTLLLFISTSTTASSTATTTTAAPTSTPAPTPTAYPVCDQSIKNVPGDYPTIQAAVDAANIGDTVKVAAGTYSEDVTLKSGICLEGAGIDQTIISKSGASGITGNGVSYVIIKDLTVQNSGCAPGVCGGGGNGGGIQLSQSSNITIQSCRLTGNVAVDGGGISLSQSSVSIDHCLIDGNTASNSGAALSVDRASTVSLTNATVVNNNWVNALGNGGVGGIRADGSGLQIANSILWGNNSQNFSGNGTRVSNSDISGWSGGTNDISSNPNFAAVANYHLQAGSPSAGMGVY